jgi:hypothetical protein
MVNVLALVAPRSRPKLLDEERGDRERDPAIARDAHADRLQPPEPSLGSMRPRVGPGRLAAQERMHAHRRARAPAGQRQLGAPRLWDGGHRAAR